jgi:hypothetical protein
MKTMKISACLYLSAPILLTMIFSFLCVLCGCNRSQITKTPLPQPAPPAADAAPPDEQASAPTNAITGAFGYFLGQKCPDHLSLDGNQCLVGSRTILTNEPFIGVTGYALDDGRLYRILLSINTPTGQATRDFIRALTNSLAAKYGESLQLQSHGDTYNTQEDGQWMYGASNSLTLTVSLGWPMIEYSSGPLLAIAAGQRKARIEKSASGL